MVRTTVAGLVAVGILGALSGCAMEPGVESDGADSVATSTEQHLTTLNGLNSINGLNSFNGLNSMNGLNSFNGLNSLNGFNAMNGLNSFNGLNSLNGFSSLNGLNSMNGGAMTSAGTATLDYVARCALSGSQTVTQTDANGTRHDHKGQIGLAPEFATGACGAACQEKVTACVLAHVNTSGQHISIYLASTDLGSNGLALDTANYPYEEGSFFGNMFTTPAHLYYCQGRDHDFGAVPGRLGTQVAGAPYTNAFNWTNATCDAYCTRAPAPNDKAGYTNCAGYTNVITVWRNFDPNTSYKVCNKMSGMCLDTLGSKTNGSAVVQNNYNGALSQKWTMVQVNPGQYKFINKDSGMVMDIYGKRTADGTALIQYPYNGQLNQLWSFTALSDQPGMYKVSPMSNTAASIGLPWQTTNTPGGPVQEWTYNTIDSEKWSIAVAN